MFRRKRVDEAKEVFAGAMIWVAVHAGVALAPHGAAADLGLQVGLAGEIGRVEFGAGACCEIDADVGIPPSVAYRVVGGDCCLVNVSIVPFGDFAEVLW